MPSLKKVITIASLISLFFLSGCASLAYKDLAQYNVILNCEKINIVDKLSSNNKISLQNSNFGFNTKDGRMVYELNQDGEYEYAQFHSKRSGKVFYKSVSDDTMLVVGSSEYGTYVAMNKATTTYTFLECSKR